MLKSLICAIFLLIALPCFSKIDTVAKKTPQINKGKPICLPDSVLRKAAEDIVRGDGFKLQLRNREADIHLLNAELFQKDSILFDQSSIIKDYAAIRKVDSIKYLVSQADKSRVQAQYKVLKFNDRLKMCVGAVIIAGLIYLFSISH